MTTAFTAQSESQHSADRASPDEIIELQRLGFKVEDLGAEYGPAHDGAFRWVNIVTGEFQQDAESHSETEAWAAAKEAAAANVVGLPRDGSTTSLNAPPRWTRNLG
jgi:hypothetical protein